MSRRPGGRALCALLLAFGCALGSGCGSQESRVAARRERAEQFVQEGRIREAILELHSALQLEPQNAELNLRLAQLFYATNDLHDALFFFEEAYRLDPSRLGAALEAANVLRWSDPARADRLVDEVLAKSPELPLAWVRRAEIALNRKDLDAAFEAASQAVLLAPDDPRPLITLGTVHEARLVAAKERGERPGDALFQEALGTFDQALALSGEDAKGLPLNERARLLAVWPGHRDDAARAYRELVEYAFSKGQESARVPVARAAADFARRRQDAELLQLALTKAVEADPGQIWAWSGLARAEERAGRPSEPVYQRMLAARQGDPKAHTAYALHLAAQDRVDDAAKHLEDAIAAGVDPAPLLGVLARLYFQSQREEDGRRVVERLQRDYPTSAEAQELVATTAIREGRPQEALAILTKLPGASDEIEVQRLLALAHLNLGEIDAATDAIERCSELGGDSALIQHLRVHIDHAARRWDDVVQGLRRLQATRSVTPVEFVMAAESFYELGKPEEGRKILEDVLARPDAPPAAAIEYARREGRRDPARSTALLEQALARTPNDAVLLHALVGLDLERKEPQKALTRLEAAAQETGGELPPLLVLDHARLQIQARQYDAAERELLALLQKRPGSRAGAELLVSVYQQQGKTDEAIASFEEADHANALAPASRVVLARLYAAAGRRDDARAQLEKALSGGDDLPGAKNDLAALLTDRREELDRALHLAQEARRALPQDPEVADTLGAVYLKKGMHEAALGQLADALELSEAAGRPRAAIQYHRGLALQALGRRDEAKQAFESALALRQEYPEAREALSKLGGGAADSGPS